MQFVQLLSITNHLYLLSFLVVVDTELVLDTIEEVLMMKEMLPIMLKLNNIFIWKPLNKFTPMFKLEVQFHYTGNKSLMLNIIQDYSLNQIFQL